MAPRANWKGFIKVGELTCGVALYTAASTSERISFHTLNRETGNRVHRQFIDQETGKPVPKEEQVKGYEVAQDQYVILEPDEVKAAVPESDKTLAVEAFLPCSEIDDTYFDRPYYLAPTGPVAEDAFVLLREGMRKQSVAALAQTVLFRRVRTVLIRVHGKGMIATTLNFDYEVRSAQEAFSGIPEMKIEGEMLDLAKHIIKTKRGEFDPREFDDRYEDALAELIRAKLEGKPIEVRKPKPEAKVVDLMEALRQSAGAVASSEKAGKPPKRAATSARTAKDGARSGAKSSTAKPKKQARKTAAAQPRRKAG